MGPKGREYLRVMLGCRITSFNRTWIKYDWENSRRLVVDPFALGWPVTRNKRRKPIMSSVFMIRSSLVKIWQTCEHTPKSLHGWISYREARICFPILSNAFAAVGYSEFFLVTGVYNIFSLAHLLQVGCLFCRCAPFIFLKKEMTYRIWYWNRSASVCK